MYINTKWFPCIRNDARQNFLNCWNNSLGQLATIVPKGSMNA
ncbi:hypothetical protein KEN49_CDS0372 [Pseudomonas phage vB_Pae3705-KEN49]